MEGHFREDIDEIRREGEESKERSYKGPLVWLIALFLILIIILMIVPYYAVRLDPEPKRIPTIAEVIPAGFTPANYTGSRNDYLRFIQPNNAVIKQVADRIVGMSCDFGRTCHAKALFYFVRDNFDYVSDPLHYEYIKTAEESLYYKVGDCDDASVLLLNLEMAIGIPSRFVFVPGHVYVQVYLPEALAKYKEDGWVNLDATCNGCGFGEIPYKNIRKEKRYLPIAS